ncbi:MAG: hypothetical protein AAF485_00210 [Chloroflexota bacterium]
MINIPIPTPSLQIPETQTMVCELLETSGNRVGVGSLLEILGCCAAHVDYMRGPVMVMKTEVVDDMMTTAPNLHHPPSWLVRIVERDRLQCIIDENETGIIQPWATTSELFTYLRPALYDPSISLSAEWLKILCWSHYQIYRDNPDNWSELPPPGEEQLVVLTDNDQINVRYLAHLIRDYVVQYGNEQRPRHIPPPPYNNTIRSIATMTDQNHSFEALYRAEGHPQLIEQLSNQTQYSPFHSWY